MAQRTNKRDGLLSALRHKDFRLLMAAFSVSAAGSWAYNVALAVFVYDQTQSAFWVGAATVGRFVPALLFGAYAGVVAERFERVRLMVTLDLVAMGLMAGVTLVAALDGPVLAAIVLAALTSMVGTVYEPAVAAVTPQAVPARDLAAANTLRNTVDNVAVVAGPAVGALLLLVGPVWLAFAVNALTFGWGAMLVSRMTLRSTPVDVTEGGRAGPLRQMIVGVRAIAGSATATVLVGYSVVASFVYGVDTVQFVVLSEQRFGTGAEGFGYLLAGLGVGGVVAASAVNRLSARPRLAGVILLGMVLYCVPTLLFLVVDDPVVAFVVQGVRGAGTLVVDVLAVTALQRSLPSELLGRVFGAFFTYVLLAISLGALVTPVLLRVTSLDTSLWFAGAVLPALCLLGLPWLRRMDEANVRHLAELAPRIDVLERIGILEDASRTSLEGLAAAATEIDVPAGTVVVAEDEAADAFYVLVEGAMSVSSAGAAARGVSLPPLGSGDWFGEIGLLEHVPRTATVTATSSSHLLRIGGDDFVEALTSASASTALLEGARTRLARTNPAGRSSGPDVTEATVSAS